MKNERMINRPKDWFGTRMKRFDKNQSQIPDISFNNTKRSFYSLFLSLFVYVRLSRTSFSDSTALSLYTYLFVSLSLAVSALTVPLSSLMEPRLI